MGNPKREVLWHVWGSRRHVPISTLNLRTFFKLKVTHRVKFMSTMYGKDSTFVENQKNELKGEGVLGVVWDLLRLYNKSEDPLFLFGKMSAKL